jgi:2-iminobutanoate/2-iminopropanoate deaminase
MRTTQVAVCLSLTFFTLVSPMHAQTTPQVRNPETMHTPRGYSHVAEVPAGSRMVFIAGQVALDKAGNLVGGNDFAAQARQVFENLRLALADVGATFKDVVKLNTYVIDIGNIAALRQVRDTFVNTAAPPASTLVEVRKLFRDDVLLEIEAVAVIPQR